MSEPSGRNGSPLLDSEGLSAFLAQVQELEERLVFTNGCFDLIHPGHVAYLKDARALGDRLLVGLNSDRSTRQLKGPGRPLVPQEGRAAVLAALRAVDGVVLFDEETPRDLILRVRPRFLVKGGDYQADDVVGAEEVRGWGGEVRIVPYRGGFSTSDLIHRIRNL